MVDIFSFSPPNFTASAAACRKHGSKATPPRCTPASQPAKWDGVSLSTIYHLILKSLAQRVPGSPVLTPHPYNRVQADPTTPRMRAPNAGRITFARPEFLTPSASGPYSAVVKAWSVGSRPNGTGSRTRAAPRAGSRRTGHAQWQGRLGGPASCTRICLAAAAAAAT
jgi:hypothetical protein